MATDMQLRAVMEMNGTAPPVAFTPGRSAARVGLGGNRDISLAIPLKEHSVALGATVVTQITTPQSWSKVVALTLEIRNEISQTAALTDIPFTVAGSPTHEVSFNSRQSTPWDFLVKVNSETGQMTLSFTLNYSGLKVREALAGVTFYEALSSGGELSIYGRHPLTGGSVSLARVDLRPGVYERQDDRFVRLLKDLALIEERTGVDFTIPEHTILFEDANVIAATANVLKTGHAQYTGKPWESISNIDQARFAIEAFDNGTPAPMALHFEGQVVVIFGTLVPLGPVTLFCDRCYITKEDLELLRNDLDAPVPGSSISIRFTPFEQCPIEARYLKWLPKAEAAAIKRLPMYAKSEEAPSRDEWTLPPMNASEAVALLKSWYEEDEQEQKESWERLKVALDEDRLSDRKLFS